MAELVVAAGGADSQQGYSDSVAKLMMAENLLTILEKVEAKTFYLQTARNQ